MGTKMIDKDELEKLMDDERKEDARREDLEYLEECKNDKEDWDMREGDYC
jgi:hypothetical protein